MLLLLVPAGMVISMEWGDKAAGLFVAAGAAFLAVGGQLAVFLRERRSESMTVHQTAYIPAIVFSQGAGNAVVIGDSKTGHKLVVTSESKPTLTDIREQSMRRSKTLKILGWLSFIGVCCFWIGVGFMKIWQHTSGQPGGGFGWWSQYIACAVLSTYCVYTLILKAESSGLGLFDILSKAEHVTPEAKTALASRLRLMVAINLLGGLALCFLIFYCNLLELDFVFKAAFVVVALVSELTTVTAQVTRLNLLQAESAFVEGVRNSSIDLTEGKESKPKPTQDPKESSENSRK
jgi:hypothetical protein